MMSSHPPPTYTWEACAGTTRERFDDYEDEESLRRKVNKACEEVAKAASQAQKH